MRDRDLGATLHYLGWSEEPLQAAARWLLNLDSEDLAGRLVALPGGRAGRGLLGRLAKAAPPSWTPPRLLTTGELVDELLRLEAPSADRLTRTLAWSKALQASKGELKPLLSRPPSDLAGWLELAERVRGLHAELAVEGLDFAGVAERLGQDQGQPAGEARRWQCLSKVQQAFREHLTKLGLEDPHEGRLRAVHEKRVQSGARVVLVGVADPAGLLRQALAQLDVPADVLVFAPESEAGGFGDFGQVETEPWLTRELPLELERWRVVASPAGQAEAALQAAAARSQGGAVSFGLADPEVTPHLERRLAEAQVGARVAAGTPVTETRPGVLLQLTADLLRDRRQAQLAALVRHPDLGPALARLAGDERLPVHELDAHFLDHLPWQFDEPVEGDAKRRDPVQALRAALSSLLGELEPADGTRPLPAWAEPLRAYLLGVFGGEPDQDLEAERRVGGALDAVAQALEGWEALPKKLAPRCGAAEALTLLLDALSGAAVPPARDTGFEREADLLGWLELPLDPAPTLVLTGVNDGALPETVRGDAFLPDGLRQTLGLLDDRRRLARDLYALTLLHESRELVLVSGRRSQGGEARQPSRLLFHASDRQVVLRLQHFLQAHGDPERAAFPEAPGVNAEPGGEPDFVLPEHMAVTAFRNYLESPRRYRLQSALHLKTHDDTAREMEPRLLGILVHEVLECLKRNTLKRCSDPEEVNDALQQELKRVALETFGPKPLPTVRLQLDQLGYRLGLFAERQAEWAAQGWEVTHVEWPARFPDPVPMTVDGEPMGVRGTIDRIDYHPGQQRFAILDYKTGESGKSPDAAHRVDRGAAAGTWKDLQLPLYTLLAQSLEVGELPYLGYVYLGRSEKDIGFREAKKLNVATLKVAFEQAHEVVRAVRAGQVHELGKWQPRDPIFAGLVGLGLLGEDDDAAEGGDA